MQLIDLDPNWLIHENKRVGFTFISPKDTKYRQSCFTVKGFKTRQQWEIFGIDADGFPIQDIQGCNSECVWQIQGGIDNANFETLSVTPSIDESAGGLWHGFITNGQIV